MTTFSSISIIFNPNSTGDAKKLADQLKAQLDASDFGVSVVLVPTERAGHAAELAYETAKRDDRPLIISSSGDGGYNELVNGAMKAQNEGCSPVCAVLAAGNANDHSHAILDRPLVEAILDENIRKIDLIRATLPDGSGTRVRYAHSYVGIGLTPTVAVELNKNKLNRFKETLIVWKELHNLQPVEIMYSGRKRVVDSVVIANVQRMAKMINIAENAEVNDGMLKVTTFPHRHRLALFRMLIKSVTKGMKGRSVRTYEFETLKEMVVQFDGEVEELPARGKVVISVAPQALSTLR